LKFRRTDPPVFVLSGPGSITYFGIGVFSPALPERSPNRVQLIWEIFPHDIFSTNIESAGQIAYGTVPPGFSQSTPASGPPLPLAPLEPGKYYVFYLLTIGASHVMGAFEMKDGKTSRVYGLPFLCRVQGEGGRSMDSLSRRRESCEVAIEITVDWPD
jgi:hypothetical protein